MFNFSFLKRFNTFIWVLFYIFLQYVTVCVQLYFFQIFHCKASKTMWCFSIFIFYNFPFSTSIFCYWDFTVFHNDPVASHDHCPNCRISNPGITGSAALPMSHPICSLCSPLADSPSCSTLLVNHTLSLLIHSVQLSLRYRQIYIVYNT